MLGLELQFHVANRGLMGDSRSITRWRGQLTNDIGPWREARSSVTRHGVHGRGKAIAID